jgi:hypothetical protein
MFFKVKVVGMVGSPMYTIMVPFSHHVNKLMANPSVNLTRNSVPHLPGMARYAHNALPGKRVTLPRAGYLKR